MKIEINDDTIQISDVQELTAGKSTEIKEAIKKAFAPDLKNIDFLCEALEFVDSSGLGALISLQKLAKERNGSFRLIDPLPPVIQLLEYTSLHRVFTIVASR